MACTNYILLVLVLFVELAYGEVIKTQKCYLSSGQKSSCTVHEVRVTPCPEAEENKPCKVKLGTNASLSFDYTPTFSATRMGSNAYKVGSVIDIGFEQMDTNGCKYTKCPVEANTKQVYNYELKLDTNYPKTVHQVKWKLWNEDDYHQQCCFKFSLQLAG